jgi:hypothetical protein
MKRIRVVRICLKRRAISRFGQRDASSAMILKCDLN